MRATVVVCTRNRARELEGALEAILGLEASFSWELLVIDNASSDDTLAIALQLARRRPERLRVFSEPVIGLSAARNCGVRLARGQWVAFLDDDATPAPGWLEAYQEALAGENVLSAGGPVVADFAGSPPAPAWRSVESYLSIWDRGAVSVDLRYNELPRGTNVAYRREAFERVGGFDRRLGRSGRSLRSCEETELGLRLERSGHRAVYAPSAGVVHRVESSRLTPGWFAQRFAAQAFSEAIVDWKHFGRKGLRNGFERLRRYERDLGQRLEETELGGRTLRGARAYLRGAFYAVVMVERWQPEGTAKNLSGSRSETAWNP